MDALTAAGCRKIFADKKSGKNALRPELKACHAFLDPGDTLVVPSLDRYGRGLQDLINMVAELRERGIGFTSLHENLDTTTPGGRLVFHVFAALAEFIRELIVIGTNEGPAAARARGRVGGRPTVATEEVIRAHATCCPTPVAPSPRSPSCSASPGHPVQPHSRPTRTARGRRPPPARSPREVAQHGQDQSQRHFLYGNYSYPESPVGSGKLKLVQWELAGRSVCIRWGRPWVRRERGGGLRQGGGLRL
ncbi:recombinase family protein [Streptomyces sp. NPDC097617]|uniref:recombinase family protein n=1 Tax=Streptomyces sp. NPDC097617 TaxID=3366091 RepID=UPI003818D9F9